MINLKFYTHHQNKTLSQRITIVLDDDLNRKLRSIQAKMLKEKNRSVSFSRVLNQVLRRGLK